MKLFKVIFTLSAFFAVVGVHARQMYVGNLKFDDKSKRLEVNGRVLYVSNQFNPERILEFETKVNNQNWGIKIDKVE